MPFDPAKLARLTANKSSKSQTGGKGSVRRKHKVVRKNAAQDDKRLKTTLNKLNVRDIPAIEEVNLFKEDGNVIHFSNPKVQASISANTYVVNGHNETKSTQFASPTFNLFSFHECSLTQPLHFLTPFTDPSELQDLLPGIINQLGPDNLENLKKLYESYAETPGGAGGDDDDVPALVENFEDASNADDMPELVAK